MRTVCCLLLLAAGCGPKDGRRSPGVGGGGAGDAGAGDDLGIGASDGFAPFDRDAACARVSAEATVTKKPVDIIFVIDRSGSMTEELDSVEKNINLSFAQIIAMSGLDYRVILISQFGNGSLDICINAPLGGNTCAGGETRPVNSANFFHYSRNVQSLDSLPLIVSTYNVTDTFLLAVGGWQTWLRNDAIKVFVEITDDNSIPETADTFEAKLFALTPRQFGDAMNRNYVFHSIIGIASHPMGANTAYQPTEPMVSTLCSTAVGVGPEYQRLSQRTGGLRFPVCNYTNYDVIFQEIAKGVVRGAQVACEFDIPSAPAPYTVDLKSITVDYAPGAGGPAQTVSQVPSAMQCAPGKFYIDKVAQKIILCPDTCNTVKADDKAKIQIFFDCAAPLG